MKKIVKESLFEGVNDNMGNAMYGIWRRDKNVNKLAKSLKPGDNFRIISDVNADWVNKPLKFIKFNRFTDTIKAEDIASGEIYRIGITQSRDEEYIIEKL